MASEITCAVCQRLVPQAESYLGKVIVGALASLLGIRMNSGGGMLVLTLLGVGVGHLIDRKVEALAAPVCGGCVMQPTYSF